MHASKPKHRHVPRPRAPAPPAGSGRTESVVLAVAGLGCERCTKRVRDGLVATVGVLRAKVDLQPARAAVNFDPTRTGLAALIRAVERAGEKSGHTYRAALAAPASDLLPPVKGARR